MNKSSETALTIFESAKKDGSLICFDTKNGFPQVELYRTEVTAMDINKDSDCFEISKKYMPKREVVDRIGEASGIIFIMGETKAQEINDPACGKHTVYTGIAQGKVRLPDGTWRISSVCEYEFDPTLRAMLDYEETELTPQSKARRKKYTDKDGVKKERSYGNTLGIAILEYQKMGRQRANTGARLRVIRELVGLPIAFTDKQLEKPVVFGRIVQNTSHILQTPEGRIMATAQALGVDVASLFGKSKMLIDDTANSSDNTAENDKINITPQEGDEAEKTEAEKLAEEAGSPEESPFPEPPPPRKETEFEQLTGILSEFIEGFRDALDVNARDGNNPCKLAEAELADPNATEESRKTMIVRIRTFLTAKGINV